MSGVIEEKCGVSLGFTLQVDDFEPVKLNVYRERGRRPDETEEDFTFNVTKEVVSELDKVAEGCVLKVQEIKAKIVEALNNEG